MDRRGSDDDDDDDDDDGDDVPSCTSADDCVVWLLTSYENVRGFFTSFLPPDPLDSIHLQTHTLLRHCFVVVYCC